MKKRNGTGLRLVNTPWLNKDGTPNSDEALRLISPSWSREVWENYLSTLEISQNHCLVDDFEGVLETHDGYRSLEAFHATANQESEEAENEESDPALIAELLSGIKELSKRQQEVVQAIYYEDKTQAETARRLGISVQRVSAILKSAIKKLRKRLTKEI